MKTLLFLIVMTLSSMALAAGDLGVGFILGAPTGVTGKKWVKSGQAIDAAAAWTIGANPNFRLHSDYLWHKEDALYFNETQPLDIYFGAGGRVNFADDIEIGLRAPVGIAQYFQDRQGEAFLEAAPILDFISSTGLKMDLMVGLRIYF
ncbi:MAG: hypothetical protein K2P81_15005 [Bacteriovoracaceae bacterium]|nr:hypothetical protein [Bacteriovoracaceae bacterium]